jgi:RNA recognition motif-containing protein
MKYQLPSLKTYMVGLLVLIGITIIASVLLPTFGIENKNVVLAVMAGLIIGHFVGTSLTAAPSNGVATKSPSNAELKTIYVGNLAFHTSKYDLYNLFKQYGKVHSSRIMFDKITKKSRGFGFVEMNSQDAEAAIEALNGMDFSGRNIKVNEANNQSPFVRQRFQ